MSFLLKSQTAWRLGPLNIARVVSYKLGMRSGLNPVRRLPARQASSPFFYPYSGPKSELPSREGWWRYSEAYGLRLDELNGAVPDWHTHMLHSGRADASRSWWQLPDFNPELGDIKGVWEASRFDWVLACAQQAASGNPQGIERLNDWLANWCSHNPPYQGVNWKCGQEASIRVMHLAMATLILRQTEETTTGLAELLTLHLQRIAPTIQYAVAQDNNHGTSEAAALFIGGTWLQAKRHADNRVRKKAKRWASMGRKWLENRVARLIEADGTFSQYSVNYHRVMLDTLCMAEVWRRELGLSSFSERFYRQARAATAWLGNLVNIESGDASNLGANDGARLLPLTDTDYRDYRPTVQLASVLFAKARAYSKSGSWDLSLAWLGVELPDARENWAHSQDYPQGGLAVLRQRSEADQHVMALLRYPCFRFRPGQSDLLHLDLWHGDCNLLRDGGSFSYNTEAKWQDYFPGVAAHNTVQFDDREQMPRLSRFLFGAWPNARDIEPLQQIAGETRFAVGYRDWQGASHHRRVVLRAASLEVEDQVEGFQHKAVLRWRLVTGNWYWEGDTLTDGERYLRVTAKAPIVRQELTNGWESRYYSQKTSLPVLEIEVNKPTVIMTELTF